MTSCSIEGCEKPAKARTWCGMHWWRWRKYGDPLRVTVVVQDDIRRFWSKVDKNGPVPEARPDLGPCWLWTGTLNEKGYGKFALGQKHVKAHRYAWMLLTGEPEPDGLEPDHLCRQRSCVRPDHLEWVTHAENMARGAPANKTECVNGHEYTEENTLRARGQRFCRECQRERRRR